MLFGAPLHVVSLIRFSYLDGCGVVHPDTWYHLFSSPIMTDAVWCTPTCGITYSVLPSWWMPFGASRHVVSIIRSPSMSDTVWCIPTRFTHHDGCCLVHPDMWYYLFGSPIMTDAVWCIPTRGINYSVSQHVGFCLVHPYTWYHLFSLPSCRMLFGASRHMVLFIQSPIMSDTVWCIPTRGITYSVLPS